uniref:Uncharacterized protein n=1 Tax=Romanomermis culicivorax TaxID=13658 RepID=A0A915IXA5_ROMCU
MLGVERRPIYTNKHREIKLTKKSAAASCIDELPTFKIGHSPSLDILKLAKDCQKDNVEVPNPVNVSTKSPLKEEPPKKTVVASESSLLKSEPIKLPEYVKYLIVGGGTAGFAAFRAIRGADAEAKVLVIGEEDNYPYMRPPLSKELWYSEDVDVANTLMFKQWSGKERNLFYEKEAFYCDADKLDCTKHGGVSVVRGRKVIKVDPSKHEAILDDESKIKFDKCLIATGGRPRNIKEIENSGNEVLKHVTLFRRVDDFKKLDQMIKSMESVVIVGGGFLGSELTSSLAHKAKSSGLKVTQLFPESDGVNVFPNSNIQNAKFDDGKVILKLQNGETVSADHVIVAVGIDPNVEIASASGLEVDPEIGGFRCDAELRARTDNCSPVILHRTASAGAAWERAKSESKKAAPRCEAGDCCSFYDQKFGRRRVEHQDHAVITGRLAGENMAGAAKPYTHQSDLGPHMGFEAIGIVDSSLPTVGVFAKQIETADTVMLDRAAASEIKEHLPSINKDFNKGVIFYMREKRIVGMLFWNLFNRIPIARRILKDDAEYEDLNEVAKLFNIHDSEPTVSSENEEQKQKIDENMHCCKEWRFG